jgi:hypothetical protein
MTAHRVLLVVKPGGEIETTVEGIDGPTCESESAWLDSLGVVTTHEHTADYYAHVSRQTTRERVSVGTGTDDEGGSHGSPW